MSTGIPATAPVIADAKLIRETREKVGAAGLTMISGAPHLGLAWAQAKPRAVVPGKTQGGTWEVSADGVLYVDGEFTKTLTPPQATFVLGHEMMHVLLQHFERAVELGLATPEGKSVPGKERELDAWAQAIDMAINHALRTDKVGEPPPNVLFPPQEYLATGGPMAAEPIYYWLLAQKGAEGEGEGNPDPNAPSAPPKGPGRGCMPLPPVAGQGAGGQGQSDPNAPPQPGQGQGAPAPAPIDWKQVSREVEALAREMGRQAGTGSAVADLLSPAPARSGWKKLIRAGFETVSADAEDRNRRSHARIARRPDLLPGIIKPGLVGTDGTIAFVLDASGSVSRELLAKAAGHILACAAEFPSVKTILVTHTDRVEFAQVMKPGGSVADVKKATGFTGGTLAGPAYEKVREMAKGKVDSLIHFTDCELFEERWPEAPARRLIIGECGEAATRGAGTERPAGARKVPVLE